MLERHAVLCFFFFPRGMSKRLLTVHETCLSCALEICVRRVQRTVPRPVAVWLVGGASCNASLFPKLCRQLMWLDIVKRALLIHQSSY